MQFADTFKNPHLKSLIAFTLGALNVFGFAPYYFYPISFITLILFFSFNKEYSKKLSFFYGLGFFISGIHWIYIALNTYGNMHPVGASISTLGLCIYRLSMAFIRIQPGSKWGIHWLSSHPRYSWRDFFYCPYCTDNSSPHICLEEKYKIHSYTIYPKCLCIWNICS
jgi:apolipoprotein N-acyltransferase